MDKDLKELWMQANHYLWNSAQDIFLTSDLLTKRLFELLNEVISLETNAFYFNVEKENLVFSIKMATIIKKLLPSITTIFGNAGLDNNAILEIVSPGEVDFFVIEEEEKTLCKIIENKECEIKNIPNTISYKNGVYQINKSEHIPKKGRDKSFLVLDRLDLNEYGKLNFPLSWVKR